MVFNTEHLDERKEDDPELAFPKETTTASASQQQQQPAIQKEKSLEQQLAEKGIPMNIRSGVGNAAISNTMQSAATDSQQQQEQEPPIPAISESEGMIQLNLDALILEEASKKYWNEFSEMIEQKDFQRLFELLTELLQRLKKVSPAKHHTKIDEIIGNFFFLLLTFFKKKLYFTLKQCN